MFLYVFGSIIHLQLHFRRFLVFCKTVGKNLPHWGQNVHFRTFKKDSVKHLNFKLLTQSTLFSTFYMFRGFETSYHSTFTPVSFFENPLASPYQVGSLQTSSILISQAILLVGSQQLLQLNWHCQSCLGCLFSLAACTWVQCGPSCHS